MAARAAEALGLLAGSAETDPAVATDALDVEDAGTFHADRVRFLRRALAGEDPSTSEFEDVGSLAGIRETAEAAVDAIAAPSGDRECPGCGLSVPPDGPPMCPRCGGPF